MVRALSCKALSLIHPPRAQAQRDQVTAINRSLVMQLGWKGDDVSRAEASKRDLESKVDEINQLLEDKEQTTFDITQAMTRQYEAMQEQLVDRVRAYLLRR